MQPLEWLGLYTRRKIAKLTGKTVDSFDSTKVSSNLYLDIFTGAALLLLISLVIALVIYLFR